MEAEKILFLLKLDEIGTRCGSVITTGSTDKREIIEWCKGCFWQGRRRFRRQGCHPEVIFRHEKTSVRATAWHSSWTCPLVADVSFSLLFLRSPDVTLRWIDAADRRAPPRLVFSFQPLKATLPTVITILGSIAFAIQFFHWFSFFRLHKVLLFDYIQIHIWLIWYAVYIDHLLG